MVKGQDNFTNSYNYIINHLFIYDYSNDEDFNTLKMKLWVLDGEITNEESDAGFIDEDINNPKNHHESLLNELTFLDRYIRTEEDDLEENERNFEELKEQREQRLERFDGEDWELPYNQRPTLLSDSQFETLYQRFKTKRTNGELTTAYDIVNSVTPYCIDTEKEDQEGVVENYEDPAVTMARVEQSGADAQDKNDWNYVKEMNTLYDEMFPMITSVQPDSTSLSTAWVNDTAYTEGDIVLDSTSNTVYICNTDHTSVSPPGGLPDDIANWDTFDLNTSYVLIGVPQRRLQVSRTKFDPSHKGSILAGAGYRFIFLNFSGSDSGVNPSGVNHVLVSHNYGQVEWNFNGWTHAVYWTNTVTSETWLLPTGVGKGDLPSGDDTLGEITEERFDECHQRWVNINRLREDQISQTGTRVMVEAMIDAVIPNLLPDHEDHFEDKKTQKQNYTRILRERCSEFV